MTRRQVNRAIKLLEKSAVPFEIWERVFIADFIVWWFIHGKPKKR